MSTARDAIMAYGPSRVRTLNATTSGDLTFEDPATDMARFDRLPAELRFRVACNNTKIACAALEPHLAWAQRNGYGAARTIARCNELETNELAVFAGQYRGRYKTDMPHVAAKASMQRYGLAGASRHPPRPFGPPVLRAPPHRRRRRLR